MLEDLFTKEHDAFSDYLYKAENQENLLTLQKEEREHFLKALSKAMGKEVYEITVLDIEIYTRSGEFHKFFETYLKTRLGDDSSLSTEIYKKYLQTQSAHNSAGLPVAGMGIAAAKVIGISLNVLGVYLTLVESQDLWIKYEKSGQSLAEFSMDNKLQLLRLSAELVLAFNGQALAKQLIKQFKSPKLLMKVMDSARKSGLTDGTKLKGVMDSLKRYLLEEAVHIDTKSIIEIFEGSAKAGWKMTKKVADDLGSSIKSLRDSKKLPDNFITKEQATKLGWHPRKGNLHEVAPGKSLGGDVWKNRRGQLPKGKTYYEADLGNKQGDREKERLVWSDDGKFYITNDHYETFTEIIE